MAQWTWISSTLTDSPHTHTQTCRISKHILQITVICLHMLLYRFLIPRRAFVKIFDRLNCLTDLYLVLFKAVFELLYVFNI